MKFSNLLLMLFSLAISAVILCMMAGYYFINRNDNSAIEITGDPMIIFDDAVGYAPNLSAKTHFADHKIDLAFDVTTDAEGVRIAKENAMANSTPSQIAFYGGSYTWGHGVSDDEAFSARLAEILGVGVRNYALAGYGTAQALLTMKKKYNAEPAIVYGFVDDHLRRNVLSCRVMSESPFCLKMPYAYFSANGEKVLVDTLTTNNFILNERLKGEGRYSPINLFIVGYNAIKQKIVYLLNNQHDTSASIEDRVELTRWILEQMGEFAANHNAKFYIVNVNYQAPSEYFASISEGEWPENIVFVDASSFPGVNPADLQVPGDGHPNALAHQLFAQRLAPILAKQLAPAAPEVINQPESLDSLDQ